MLHRLCLIIACVSIVFAAAVPTTIALPTATPSPTCRPGQKFFIQANAPGTKFDGYVLSRGPMPANSNYIRAGTSLAMFQPAGKNATIFSFNSDCTVSTVHTPTEQFVGYYSTLPETVMALDPDYGMPDDYYATPATCKVDIFFNLSCDVLTRYTMNSPEVGTNGQLYYVALPYPTDVLGSPPGVDIKLRQIPIGL